MSGRSNQRRRGGRDQSGTGGRVRLPPPAAPADTEALSRSDRERLALVLAGPARRRLDALVEAPDVARLVPAIDPDFLAVTVLEAGHDRFAPLVRYASDDQIRHIVDLGSWEGDALDATAAVDALAALSDDEGETWMRWFRVSDWSFVVTLFARLIVVATDDMPPPGKLSDVDVTAPFSLDGLHAVWPRVAEHEGFVRSFLTRLWDLDQDGYLALMTSVQHALEAESEADAFGMRERRLVEYGFPPPEQAAEILEPPAAERMAPVRVAGFAPPVLDESPDAALVLAAPDIPLDATFLGKCAAMLPEAERRRAREALDRTGRLLLSAEFGNPGDLAARRDALRSAGMAVSLGLEHLSGGEPSTGAALLVERTVLDLFRVGHALARGLWVRAVAVRRSRWFEAVPSVRSLLDPAIAGVLDACARPRPLRWAGMGAAGKPALEPFRSVAEIAEARRVLDLAAALGRLIVEGLGLDGPLDDRVDLSGCLPSDPAEVRAGDILRTAAVVLAARGTLRFDPVGAADVALALELATVVASRGRRLDEAFRRRFAEAVVGRLPEATEDERSALESYVVAALDALDDEIRGIDPARPIDVRFVGGIVRRTGVS